MRTAIVIGVALAIFGAILTPIMVSYLLPGCYSENAEISTPPVPSRMVPWVILSYPGLIAGSVVIHVGIPFGIVSFILGGVFGHGAIGIVTGGVVAAIRKRLQRRV